MPLQKFVGHTLAGSALWCSALVGGGLALLVLLVLLALGRRLHRRSAVPA